MFLYFFTHCFIFTVPSLIADLQINDYPKWFLSHDCQYSLSIAESFGVIFQRSCSSRRMWIPPNQTNARVHCVIYRKGYLNSWIHLHSVEWFFLCLKLFPENNARLYVPLKLRLTNGTSTFQAVLVLLRPRALIWALSSQGASQRGNT